MASELARLGGAPAGLPDVLVRVRLDGEGGGAWDLRVGADGLRVGAPGADEPNVTVRQTVDDWRALALGDGAAGVSLRPPSSASTDVLFLDPTARRLLATVRGLVRFEIAGFAGRAAPWRLDVKLGTHPAPASPNATITTDAETYAQMAARKLPPPEAYFSGRIKIAGDAGLAMQLAMVIMPRFT